MYRGWGRRRKVRGAGVRKELTDTDRENDGKRAMDVIVT